MTLRIGISTCPNDTFAFAALYDGRVGGPELDWVLDDVEALNEMLIAGELDVAKASFHAALLLAGDYVVLPVGAALGFGVGPLLLAAGAERAARAPLPGDRVVCPGRLTTATLLYRMFHPGGPAPSQCVFSEIMPRLTRGEADYGVVIHEGRFTYEQHGLALADDLGARWEHRTGVALPLGGIVVRNDLDADVITSAIRSSLLAARADPELALPFMQRHAQELGRAVLDEHVRLYVNEATLDLGAPGRTALDALAREAAAAGIVSHGTQFAFAD